MAGAAATASTSPGTLDTDTNTNTNTNTNTDTDSDQSATPKKGIWLVRGTISLLLVDVLVSILLMSSILPWVRHQEDDNNNDNDTNHHSHYSFSGSLLDLLVLSVCRVATGLSACAFSYARGTVRESYPFPVVHPNGTKKTRDELEEEALEQSVGTWIERCVRRAAFPHELLCLATALVAVAKCLVRLEVEIGRLDEDRERAHCFFWLAFAYAAVVAVVETIHLDATCVVLGEWGSARKATAQQQPPRIVRRISSHLSLQLPLLENDGLLSREGSGEGEGQSEFQSEGETETAESDEEGRSTSEASSSCDDCGTGSGSGTGIGSDTDYKASWSDLLKLCAPDAFLIAVAFVFLLFAAAMQIYIPKYTGACLDALEEAYSRHDDDDGTGDDNHNSGIDNIPGFMSNVKKLIVVSVLGGFFSGVRGSIFTVVGGRVNVRLRLRLMDALLTAEQGFFDVTKTGDITSRLSSDTTLVGDQVALNVNVFLRSLVQVVGVLIFMFTISWQLSMLAFISVPVVTILSRWYGTFIRSLSKVMQTKLAEGNSVSEAALSSMPTVRAFDAAPTEYKEFTGYMNRYLELTFKQAVAYCGYATVSTSLPQLVTALVVFYGGLLVRNGHLSSGELVSFLLYLQSLSDAFSSIGYIFSSLTQAVGAADKVFELMHRKRKVMPQTLAPTSAAATTSGGSDDYARESSIVEKVRKSGLEPSECRGEVTLRDVEMYYPARPNKRVLNGMSLSVPPGSIVALVGPSGGGKSSIISLVQNLYSQSSGKVMLDNVEVHEYSPRWLSHHISIVQQEPTLFARSIRRNIMYGLEGTDREPTQEEIERVARLSNCDDFIRKMPLQYETEVGERGVQLSGGQKQRIAIARALVRKPKILLLDEATSALDAESEHMVQSAIDHMIETARSADGAGMSVMIVAHRLSTIRNADIIFVVQDGRVVEQGNHSELIQREDGPYASLVRRQMNVQSKLEGDEK